MSKFESIFVHHSALYLIAHVSGLELTRQNTLIFHHVWLNFLSENRSPRYRVQWHHFCFPITPDYDQFMEGTPMDLALNLGCDIFSCLCKATSDVIRCSENNPGTRKFVGWQQLDVHCKKFWVSYGVIIAVGVNSWRHSQWSLEMKCICMVGLRAVFH